MRGVHVHNHQPLRVLGQDVNALQLGQGFAERPGDCGLVVVGGGSALQGFSRCQARRCACHATRFSGVRGFSPAHWPQGLKACEPFGHLVRCKINS